MLVNRYYISNADVSVRMFKTGLLERLSHVHPAAPHVMFVPVVGYMLYATYQRGAEPGRAALLFLLGPVIWSLTEYLVHRFVFHIATEKEDQARDIVRQLGHQEPAVPALATWAQKRYWVAHGVHHDFPNDSRRLVMPPAISIPLAVLFYQAFKLVLGATYAPALFAGFVAGYLVYDTTHYAVHHFRLRSRLGRALKKHHSRHHYLDPAKDFGVSSALWDVILSTVGRKDLSEEV